MSEARTASSGAHLVAVSVAELNLVLERLHEIEAFKARAHRLQRQQQRLKGDDAAGAGGGEEGGIGGGDSNASAEKERGQDEEGAWTRQVELDDEQKALEKWVLGLSKQSPSLPINQGGDPAV